jgi:hypothetical protein
MPDRIPSLSIPVTAVRLDRALTQAAARHLRVPPAEVLHVELLRRSLDARRRRSGLAWTCQVLVFRQGEASALEAFRASRAARLTPAHPGFRRPGCTPPAGLRPVIVGAGPAGLFAALTFADHGVPCTILERGRALPDRHHDVGAFRREGRLDPESNVCFGEGGAGTYSDGKLYTRKHHPLVAAVLERFVALGAHPDLLVEAHPHVGTNRLYGVLQALRGHLLRCGCTLRSGARVDGLRRTAGRVSGAVLASGEEVAGSPVLLCTGHSAHDVYRWLAREGVRLEAKPLAIGARLEHPQALIDEIRLGGRARPAGLGAAEYAFAAQAAGRGVYSFCMCPGGFVIASSTEPGCLNVNGMSMAGRASPWANAAVVATVEPADFYLDHPGDLAHEGPLAGLAFVRALERRAFAAGGETYRAPAQRLTDFLERRVSMPPPRPSSYRMGLVPGDVGSLLPPAVAEALRLGLRAADRQGLRGLVTSEALLIGVETTTSSPVRVVRGDDRQAAGAPGLYPLGEGAGYSGGIVSSAMEGILAAWGILGA